MTHIVKIYSKLQLLHLRVYLEYEADFWIGIFGMLLKHSVNLIFIWTIFQFTPQLHGWNLWEMAFLYGLYILPRGLVELLYDGQWRLPQLVNRGEFDRLLLRPISPALQVITQIASIHGVGSVIIGGIVLGRAAQELHVSWSIWQAGFFLITIVNSVILIGSLNYITNCITFWDPAQNAALPVFVQNITEFAKYPSSIYGKLLQTCFTLLLPLSFVSYLPGTLLLHKEEAVHWLAYMTPVSGVLVIVVTALIWRRCLAIYQGSGS